MHPDFPFTKAIWLDNASTTQKPRVVLDRMHTFYTEENSNIHRGVYPLSEAATASYEGAREIVATFLNAQTKEIVFTKNATEALNTIAHGLCSLTSRKKIVLTLLNHHANIVPWQVLAKKHNMELVFIGITKDFCLDMEDARKKIDDNTAIVAFSHASNALGSVVDAKALTALAHKHGALSVVDAAQSAPHLPLDVSDIDCDFLVFSGHKVYGPTGIGVLFGKYALLEKLPPLTTGGDMIMFVTQKDHEFQDAPAKFEAGTPPIAQAIGLGTALTYLLQKGLASIAQEEQALRTYALEQLSIPGIRIVSPQEGIGVLSFIVEGAHPHDTAALLGEQGICVRGGHHCCMPLMNHLNIAGTTRMSLGLINTKEDIDALAGGLKKIVEVFA